MDSFSRSHSPSKNSRSRRNTTNTTSRLTPNMAAAMLSLHWPQPEQNRPDEDDLDENDQRSRASNSRRLHRKKSTNGQPNNNYEDDELIEYEPVTIPEFHEVQTAWPGFDHEPVPNWEEKYMIAKPYPRNEAEISYKSSYINYGNDPSTISNKKAGLQGESSSKSKSKVKSKKQNGKATNSNLPRRVIRVERVGSCIK